MPGMVPNSTANTQDEFETGFLFLNVARRHRRRRRRHGQLCLLPP